MGVVQDNLVAKKMVYNDFFSQVAVVSANQRCWYATLACVDELSIPGIPDSRGSNLPNNGWILDG